MVEQAMTESRCGGKLRSLWGQMLDLALKSRGLEIVQISGKREWAVRNAAHMKEVADLRGLETTLTPSDDNTTILVRQTNSLITFQYPKEAG